MLQVYLMQASDEPDHEWTNDVFDEDEFLEMLDVTDKVLHQETNSFTFTLNLTLAESVNLLKRWRKAFYDNDEEMMDTFIGAIAGYMAYLEQQLGQMGVDTDEDE
jgi:hypothetical protein